MTMLAERFLEQVVATNQPTHAYLFFGPATSTKEKEALDFAKGLLCKAESTKPCNACRSCRKVDSGNHPDFRVIQPEGEKIKIAQIRSIRETLSYPPLEACWKVILISKAEAFTEEAAQSLLKSLEEPPSYVVFILVASHPSSLLPTITSRCQRVPFQTQEMHTLFANLEISNEEVKTWEELLNSVAPSLFSEIVDPLDVFDKVTALEDFKEEGNRIARLLFAFYRDVATIKSGWEEGLLFPQFKLRAIEFSEKLSWREIQDALEKIEEARKHLEHSGNFRLVMENLFWRLRAKEPTSA